MPADQAALFGAVASDSTCWRLLDRLDAPLAGRGRAGACRRAGGGCGPSAPHSRGGRSRPHMQADASCRA